MKIRIMTFHTAKNYGALLQAYALQKKLKNNYSDIKNIDYNTKELRSHYPLINKFDSFKGFLVALISLLKLTKKKMKYKKFNEFINDHITLTRRYENTEELYQNFNDYDLVISGSDQVFNPNKLLSQRKAYYLDFVTKNKISYAASFGTDSIEEGKKEEIYNYLKSFNTILLRETSGLEMLQNLGLEGEEVLDPVFLLDENEWRSIAVEYKKVPKKYLLYYRLLDNKESDKIVEEAAKELNLEIVVLTDIPFNRVKSKYQIRDAGPSEFLWLYANAEYVFTNSFHGTAFSIIFKKKFIFCDEVKHKSFRAVNLINKLGIKDRVSSGDIKHLISNKIDYTSVYKKLNKAIDHSNLNLLNAINKVEKAGE